MNFKKFRSQIQETIQEDHGEVVDSFKVGSGEKQYPAKIETDGDKFYAYVDGEELDSFKSEEEARKGIEDFVKLVDM